MKAVANRFSPRAAIIGLGSVLTAVVVPSCPLLMDSGLLKRVKDVTGPSIVIHSPSDGDVCANIVQVDGTVSDSATAAGNDGGATSLTYQVLGTTVSGEIAVAADGSSSFQLATITFGNTFTLSISATVGTELVDARSPLELTGMRNGYIHVFQLFAVPEDSWPRSVSGLVRTVPLSEQSLSPQGEGEVSGIRVSWVSIPADDVHEVSRATDIHGDYVDLSVPVRETEFFDTDGSNGLRVFEVSDPSQMKEVARLPCTPPLSAFSLSVNRDLAALLQGDGSPVGLMHRIRGRSRFWTCPGRPDPLRWAPYPSQTHGRSP